ncbi:MULTISPECIES: GAF domain-containing protein [unclassified Streptomyces]|uniref:GAF domain-containing protein n=1 Tax=unclassified Streptomyces TaxID=2593676 RepID=UPI002DD8A78D|nr:MULTISPECIES: GAF domain-containing protein [unclassified Streptomyces]WSA93134.1 GAF domain-containing protein [Streptomyces sp. NBC_01795]WSB77505.1 GAF domain-containing protein [Streptomyces sp. NBC_01775]WSS14229.1 GAF domain-containing protein [Streptomyces sp. NBC_01186]WSS43050.1 GAF domain-containing protein [Streptomyces sp. NBC_01187]
MSFTTSDHTARLLLTPEDADAPARVGRLQELGIGEAPVPEFDEFARELARVTGAPFAMVNFIDEHRQYFSGLYDTTMDPANGPVDPAGGVGRVMARDHGYCPHVVVRRTALVLEDVRDFPRFAVNPVVDEVGIHSYLGAPLLDPSGIALGTICVVDQRPRPWGRQGLRTIKTMAAQLQEEIQRRGRAG